MFQQNPHKQTINLNCFFKTLSILTILIFASFSARAEGEVDSSFNVNVGFPTEEIVSALAVQPDGKFLIGGKFTQANGVLRNSIARFNADGSLDASFNAGLDLRLDAAAYVTAITVQPDGKILIGGPFTHISGAMRRRIARLNSDGSLDTSYVDSGIYQGVVNTIAVLPDGKILAGGLFGLGVTAPDGSTVLRSNLARFNQDGAPDLSFDQNPPSAVNDIVVQGDGKVYVALGSSVGSSFAGVVRLNQNGSLDNSFTVPANTNNSVNALALQLDNKIIAAGSFTAYGGVAQGRITRLNTDGSIDTSFNINNAGADNTIEDAAVAPDGKIVIVGSFNSYNGIQRRQAARLNADGSLDTSFNFNGPATGINFTEVAVLPDGRVLVAGQRTVFFGNLPNSVYRLNVDGTVDASFSTTVHLTMPRSVADLAVQPDGKILAGGNFTIVNNFPRIFLFRMNADGSIDSGFNPNIGTGSGNRGVYVIAVQADGKILVGGDLAPDLQRLNPDGSRDTTFSAPNAVSGEVYALAVQSDGKILVSGTFGIMRLNPNGTRDDTFNASTIFVYETILQPDGKIVIVGSFIQVNNTARNRIARLNADGSLDTSFNPPFGANEAIFAAALQPDGKIIIGGQFTAVNGTSRQSLARLNPDGSLDNNFTPSANFQVGTVVLQPDGKILVGGLFTAINGITRNRYARLNADGTLDLTLDSSVGADYLVQDFALQQNGRILIGGSFTQINGETHFGLARLLNSNFARRTLFDFDGDGRADFSVFRPSNSYWYILNSSNNSFTAVQFGAAGDLIAPADYDGDGRADIAVFRENVPGAGGRAYFYIQQSSSNSFRPEQFGAVGDKPVPADFDGDGKADLAVYRDGSQTGGQSYFFYRPSSQPGVDFRTIAWGVTGDKPAPADYDGDGRQDAAVFRPSNGTWYILRSSDNQILAIRFGLAEDVPTPADFNGDGRAEVAVFRPSTGTWYTSIDPATNYGAVRWGVSTDVPVAADYDGDGRADVAVFRPETGNWYVLRSSSGFLGIQWGTTNDKPAPAPYVP